MKALLKEMNRLEHLDRIIRTKVKGTPEQIAKRLSMSERGLYREIAELRKEGIKIAYCKTRHCYYYEVETFLKFQASVIENGKERKIFGGENNFTFFEEIFYTDKKWQSRLSPLLQVDKQRRNKAVPAVLGFWGLDTEGDAEHPA